MTGTDAREFARMLSACDSIRLFCRVTAFEWYGRSWVVRLRFKERRASLTYTAPFPIGDVYTDILHVLDTAEGLPHGT